jgi:hypothetical protein
MIPPSKPTLAKPRAIKPSFTVRTTGHLLGVLGAVTGLDALATSVDPHYLTLFPFSDTGVQQAPAALISIGLIALASWMVTERAVPAKAKIDPPETH